MNNHRLNLQITQVVLIFCFLFFTSLSEAAFWENILAFPQAKRIKQEEVTFNNNPIQVTVYSSTASLEEITEFYKTRLITFGWSFTSEIERQGEKTLIFSKGLNFANITIQPAQENGLLIITQGTLRGGSKGEAFCPECEKKQAKDFDEILSSDSPGRDLQFVPRYPEAVRVSNIERENGKKVSLAYFSKDSVEQVADFYQQNMGNYYWKLENEIDFQDLPEEVSEKMNVEIRGKTLVFKSATASCIISIIEERQIKGTIIGVNYNEK